MGIYVNPLFRERFPASLLGQVGPLAAAAASDVRMDTSNILNLGEQLREARRRQSVLEEAIRQSPDLARMIGRDVVKQGFELTDLIHKYMGIYGTVFGNPPEGFSGIVVVVAAVAVGLAAIGAALYLWFQRNAILEEQAKAQTLAEANRQSLIAAAEREAALSAQSQAAGDQAGAADHAQKSQALYQQAGVPGVSPGGAPSPKPDQGFLAWFQDNAKWVLPLAAGVFIAPPLIRSLTD